jgi:hypothetical protein
MGDNGPDDDCTEVFLSHARVYVFADYHGISTLQYVSLRKLRQALIRYTHYEEGASDLVQLLEYSFGNTADKGDWRDPLRNLVCIYIACNVEFLWQNHEFRNLFDTLKEFPGCLMSVLQDRLT